MLSCCSKVVLWDFAFVSANTRKMPGKHSQGCPLGGNTVLGESYLTTKHIFFCEYLYYRGSRYYISISNNYFWRKKKRSILFVRTLDKTSPCQQKVQSWWLINDNQTGWLDKIHLRRVWLICAWQKNCLCLTKKSGLLFLCPDVQRISSRFLDSWKECSVVGGKKKGWRHVI